MSASDSDRAVANGQAATIVGGAAAAPLIAALFLVFFVISLWIIAYPFVAMATAAVAVGSLFAGRSVGAGLPPFGSAIVCWVAPIALSIAALWWFSRLDYQWAILSKPYRLARHIARLVMTAACISGGAVWYALDSGRFQRAPQTLLEWPRFLLAVARHDLVLTLCAAAAVVLVHFYFWRWRWGADWADDTFTKVGMRSIYRPVPAR